MVLGSSLSVKSACDLPEVRVRVILSVESACDLPELRVRVILSVQFACDLPEAYLNHSPGPYSISNPKPSPTPGVCNIPIYGHMHSIPNPKPSPTPGVLLRGPKPKYNLHLPPAPVSKRAWTKGA